MRMSADLRDLFLYEAFLYYNPLLLVALMIWLWGVNLWVFAQSSVNYARVFDLAQTHLSHREIWRVCLSDSCLHFLFVLLYAILLMILLSPFDMFYLSSRFYFLRTVWRIMLPLQAITFPDFFLADIFTSMSKVFSDLERSVCRMVNRQVATIAWFEADSICGSHSVAIPLVLVFPYLWRFFQCLRQYRDTKEKTCLFNALKYSTAVPVIFLSALKYHVFPDKWMSFYRPLWLISSVINSLYSFYWDIKRDWDLSLFMTIILQVYYWVLGSNLVLRCTWTYKLSAHLRHNYLTLFTIAALEIMRRFQWVFFRVENEWNKMTAKQNLEMSSDMPSEGDRLLDSSSHTVASYGDEKASSSQLVSRSPPSLSAACCRGRRSDRSDSRRRFARLRWRMRRSTESLSSAPAPGSGLCRYRQLVTGSATAPPSPSTSCLAAAAGEFLNTTDAMISQAS
ncbi:hypothetical protein ABZP36_035016 [Zizania latifolia]